MSACIGVWNSAFGNGIFRLILLFYVFVLTFCSKDDEPKENLPHGIIISESEALSYIEDKYTDIYCDWYILSENEKRNFFDAESYLGYFIRDISLVYLLTKQESAKQVVEDAFQFICTNYKTDGRIIPAWTSQWLRDVFGRDCRLFYEAYQYTKSEKILIEIENQVNLWVLDIKRDSHNGFLIFRPGVDENGMYFQSNIDPNQNMVLAWLFSELYWCEESSFYKRQEFKDIVFNEVNAALSLQREDGALSLAEHLPAVYDSNYGGYTSSILYNICQMWGVPEWIEALKRMGLWLYVSFPMSHPWNEKSDYPNWAADRFYASNLLGRMSAFYAAGIESNYAHAWVSFIKEKFSIHDRNLVLRDFCTRSFPRSYFIEGFNDRKFDFIDEPLFFIGDDIRIVGRNIDGLCINDIQYVLSEKNKFNVELVAGINVIKVICRDKVLFVKRLKMDWSQYLDVHVIDYEHSLFH